MALGNNVPIRLEVIEGAENFCHGISSSVEFLKRKQLHKSALGEDQLAKFIELDEA